MDLSKIKQHCQFCLKLQTDVQVSVEINDEIKENFFRLTSKQLNVTTYNDKICCYPCLAEFEAIIAYRDRQINNQTILEDLLANLSDSSVKLEEVAIKEEVKEEEFSSPNWDEGPDLHLNLNSADVLDISGFVSCETNENQQNNRQKLKKMHKKNSKSNSRKLASKKLLGNPVACSLCGKEFLLKIYLNNHMVNVHSETSAICQHCGKEFKSTRYLDNHMLTHLTDAEKKFKCDQCPRKFYQKNLLLRHKRIHDGDKPFVCHICSKSFNQSYALTLHFAVHSDTKYECDKCGAQFNQKISLKVHVPKCKLGIAVLRRRRLPGSSQKQVSYYKCFIEGCDRQFTIRTSLGKHLEKVHNLKFDNFSLTCHICQKISPTIGEHNMHVRSHTCQFSCSICNRKYKDYILLQSHTQNHHKSEDDRLFACQEPNCDARYKKASHLRTHHLDKHSTEEKAFECEFCGFKMRQRAMYKIHVRTHTNDRPFGCWQCEYGANTSTGLSTHMSKVHNEVCIYKCKMCEQKFKFHKDFLSHEKEH